MATILNFRNPGMKRGKPSRPKEVIAEPTPEQRRDGAFELSEIVEKGASGRTIKVGKAYRRKPMVEVLYEAGLFNRQELKALLHYRHHVDLIDRSPLKDSLRKLVRVDGGSAVAPSRAMLNAAYIVRQCEQAAGSLIDILRAVAIDDMSLSAWTMGKYGAVEQCREKKGRTVCTLEPRRKMLEAARLEMKIAAQRVMAELDA